MPTTIALVEDNESLRRRFIERFRFFEDVELVLAAGSGEDFLDGLGRLPDAGLPQVVLMDIELPGISGIETTARLKEGRPEIDVIMLTVFEDEDRIFDSIRAGASGYLLKDDTTDTIVGAVMSLVKGGAPMSPLVARKMLSYVRSSAGVASASAEVAPAVSFDLTDRETEILQLVVDDELENVIADRLHISPHTVRTHIKNIYRKLHVHSRASAVRVAFEHNLLR